METSEDKNKNLMAAKIPRKKQRLNIEKVANDLEEFKQNSCCERKCHEGFSAFQVTRIREQFWEKDEEQQNTFIINFLRSQRFSHALVFHIDRVVCQKFWFFVIAYQSLDSIENAMPF
uniref:Uncharacterized protein n=1 Tax=Clytia hemisphaerica TaxID=252671 RepID=A0A7M5WS31_9CNID